MFDPESIEEKSLETGFTEHQERRDRGGERSGTDASSGSVLVRTHKTLISAGTERMLVDFGRSGWLSKARQQPDKVKMVIEKVRTDGLLPTVDAVTSKLDQPLALGYCNVGRVSELGAGVERVFRGRPCRLELASTQSTSVCPGTSLPTFPITCPIITPFLRCFPP